MHQESHLSTLRKKYKPKLSPLLKNIKFLTKQTKIDKGRKEDEKLKSIFPKTYGQNMLLFKRAKSAKASPQMKIGVVFSGGQASGGHNVIAGIFDALKVLNKESSLIGFLGGPSGIVDGKHIEITQSLIAKYRNQGGFDLIGSGRTKIETQEQLAAAKAIMDKLKLDGVIIIGGDDSNTNAAIMAEYFLEKGCQTRVIGVPKTIDGDLKNEFIQASFGFDTATKVFSEIIGNIACDALSAKKYYHFIKLMGRSASHIALECALQTHPNYVFIGEEVEKSGKTLDQVIQELADIIQKRAEIKKNYGVILVPEGLIEFIPEMKTLIKELNTLLAQNVELSNKLTSLAEDKAKIASVLSFLPENSKKTFSSLPDKIKLQLLLDRDPHGNVQVSLIETEKLLMEKVGIELKKRMKYKDKFNSLAHFLGYEGRASFPSNFDADYCYNLGFVAVALLKEKLTGYICGITNLSLSYSKWSPIGIPLTRLMNIEVRKGKEKPVIKKALVDLEKAPYKTYLANKEKWLMEDCYVNPGPIQYFGSKKLTDKITLTMEIENE